MSYDACLPQCFSCPYVLGGDLTLLCSTLLPDVRWAQRADTVYLKVDVDDRASEGIDVNESRLTFHATKKNGDQFRVVVEFFADVETGPVRNLPGMIQ